LTEQFYRPIRTDVEYCEFVDDDIYYWSKGNKLYRSEGRSGNADLFAEVPIQNGLKSFLNYFSLGRRLARLQFYNVVPLSNGEVFFTFADEVGLITTSNKVSLIPGRLRKSKVLRNGIARLPDGSLIFGEYFSNSDRSAVNIYRFRPGENSVELAYSFEAGEIRHVHSVRYDQVTDRVLVCTGDLPAECRILSFSTDFDDFQILGCGSEAWRAISIFCMEDSIYFGTDAQFSQNYITKYCRQSRKLVKLAAVNGPIFYGTYDGKYLYFFSSVENCPSQTTPTANVYKLDLDGESVQLIAEFHKDIWPRKLFQMGIIVPPNYLGNGVEVYMSGISLSDLKHVSFLSKVIK
jgi:hypothetical protein